MRQSIWKLFAIDLIALVAALITTGFATAEPCEFRNDSWSADDINILASLRLSQLPQQPSDPSNAVEKSRAAVELGKRLFNDPRFSRNQAVSCASCHDPQKAFQDGLPVGRGVGTGSYEDSRFDRYVEGVVRRNSKLQQVLSPVEVNGLRAFIGKGQCVTCHNGPLLTDQHFHNTGVPQRNPDKPDRGRAAAIAKVQQDEFNCLGPFSDAKAEQCLELRFLAKNDPLLEGAFKTPSLRSVALRPPFMHAGQFASLDEVIRHYASAPSATVGHSELARVGQEHAERKPIRLTDQEMRDLAAFLVSLSSPIVESATK